MIVLGKNKVDERFNISDEGIITDLNGNVQKVYFYGGDRPIFKSVGVHKIQMWTNYGWRDGKIWNIHHKDENKLNNSLNNLVYLTCSEHMRLHKKGAHWSLSLETREKMSRSKKGKKYWLGKHHSEETRKKMSKSQKGLNTWTKGKYWFNDGVKNYICRECPPGCVKGRLKIGGLKNVK